MMQQRTTLIFFVVAMVLAACGEDRTRDGRLPEWATGPSIEVIGRAYIEVPPNRARFSVTFEEKAELSADASVIIIEKAKQTAEAIRAIGGENVLVTSNLDIKPYYQQVKRNSGRWNEQLVENVHPDSLLGYVVSSTVTVVLHDTDIVARVRGAALAASPTRASDAVFYLEPGAPEQRAAYHAAVQDAQDRARLASQSVGRELGRAILVQEGAGQCLGYLTSPAGRSPVQPSEYADFGREKVTVTGARIRRDEFSSAEPLQVINADSARSFGVVDAETLVEAAGDYAMSADPTPQRLTATVCAVYAVR